MTRTARQLLHMDVPKRHSETFLLDDLHIVRCMVITDIALFASCTSDREGLENKGNGSGFFSGNIFRNARS